MKLEENDNSVVWLNQVMKMFKGQWSTVPNTTVKSNKLRNENWLQDLAMWKIPGILNKSSGWGQENWIKLQTAGLKIN